MAIGVIEYIVTAYGKCHATIVSMTTDYDDTGWLPVEEAANVSTSQRVKHE